jgi:protein O-mannosyl-transferase
MKTGLLLFFVTLAAYVPALRAGFVWDDEQLPLNPIVDARDALTRIWTPGEISQYYPLTFTSFWLERKLWGRAPAGYHLVNSVFHAANAVLAWLVLTRLGVGLPWLAALLFALHPVHVESVAWVAERKNVLSGFFYLAAALAFLENKRAATSAALGLFLLGLLSKTVTCSLPAALLVALWWRAGRLTREDVARTAPFFALGLAFGLMTSWLEVHAANARGPEFDLTLGQRCLVAGRALWFYLSKLAFPAGLAFNYPRWRPDALSPLWAVSALALAGGLLGLKSRGPAAAALFFGGTLFPALGFFTIYPQRFSFVADHFQYLASLGPIALAAGALARVKHGRWAGAALAVVFGGATFARCGAFETRETLWRDTLRKNPESFLAHLDLGTSLSDLGRVQEAEGHLRAALAVKPDLPEARNNLGSLLSSTGRLEAAEAELREAVRIKPDYAEAYSNLGYVLGRRGKTEEGELRLSEALRINPSLAGARFNLALVLERAGKKARAREEYEATLRLVPGYSPARAGLERLK